MRYIDFRGDKISKLSLGTVQFGLDYGIANKEGKPKQDKVDKIIKFVIDNGINCFDTASAYGDSQKVLGSSFNTLGVNPYVVSKLKSNIFNLSLEDSIKDSLENLQINSLFALLLHDSDLLNNWNNNYSNKVKILKEKRKIKYFGVSIYTTKEFDLAILNKDIDIIQIPFNIFDQRAIKENWFEKAKENNKLLFIRSVYLQGLLLMDIDKIPQNLEKAKPYLYKLEQLSNRYNIDKNELSLSFVNSIAKNSIILFGCDNINQAKENIEIFNNLKSIDTKTIIDTFRDIDESIYNPTKWR
jgi:aryl-alcohol dehydrogenase-like predicted oxidoreductase